MPGKDSGGADERDLVAYCGLYCGACHGKVAFPTYDCQLCHTAEVH